MKRISLLGVILLTASLGFSEVIKAVEFLPSLLDSGGGAVAANSTSSTSATWDFTTSYLFGGTAETGTQIFGGMNSYLESETGTLVDTQVISRSSDRLVIGNADSADSGGLGVIQGVLLWGKADFLNGGDSATVRFDAGCSLYTKMFRNYGDTRWVIRDGSTYYISSAVFTGGSNLGVENTLNSGDTTWAVWNPEVDFAVVPESGYSAMTFSDVTAVGLQYDQARSATSTAGPLFTMMDSGFIANLNVVPEPASIGLVLLGAGALSLYRRCKA